RIDASQQTRVEAKVDHSPQPLAVPFEQLSQGRLISPSQPLGQSLVVLDAARHVVHVKKRTDSPGLILQHLRPNRYFPPESPEKLRKTGYNRSAVESRGPDPFQSPGTERSRL